jgi:hypothetical protein
MANNLKAAVKRLEAVLEEEHEENERLQRVVERAVDSACTLLSRSRAKDEENKAMRDVIATGNTLIEVLLKGDAPGFISVSIPRHLVEDFARQWPVGWADLGEIFETVVEELRAIEKVKEPDG